MESFLLFQKKVEIENRIFAGSFLNNPLQVRDEIKLELDFSTECSTERSVYDLLTLSGFDIRLSGTDYLLFIFVHCLNTMTSPRTVHDFYLLIKERFGKDCATIKKAIVRALEAVHFNNISNLNEVFGASIFHKDIPICPGTFICNVCGRLLMMKSHNLGKTFFA